MATAKKHMERSHRSHKAVKPFAAFEQKVAMDRYLEAKASLVDRMVSMLRRTQEK